MPTPPIIVIKKKSGHDGHHGGAWKVAYADFVTAMMALFIVLWLTNTSKPIQLAVSGYFKDPSGTGSKLGSSLTGSGETLQVSKQDMAKLKEELQKSIEKMNDLEKLKKNIEMTVTTEGLFPPAPPDRAAERQALLIHHRMLCRRRERLTGNRIHIHHRFPVHARNFPADAARARRQGQCHYCRQNCQNFFMISPSSRDSSFFFSLRF